MRSLLRLSTSTKLNAISRRQIQIAALTFIRHNMLALDNVRINSPDLNDTSLVIRLPTTGLVPVIFTLACINQYGRHSWYLIGLSSVTWVLFTTTLVYVTDFWFKNRRREEYSYAIDIPDSYEKCDIACGNCDETWSGLCDISSDRSGPTDLRYIWAVWVLCCIWLCFCILRKALGRSARIARLANFMSEFDMSSRWRMAQRGLRYSISIVTWMFCFGFQVYWHVMFFKEGLVSTN